MEFQRPLVLALTRIITPPRSSAASIFFLFLGLLYGMGFVANVTASRPWTIESVNEKPRLWRVRNVLSPHDCAIVRRVSGLQACAMSQHAQKLHDNPHNESLRTYAMYYAPSTPTCRNYLNWRRRKILRKIRKRLHTLVGSPWPWPKLKDDTFHHTDDEFLVTRYFPGEGFREHVDQDALGNGMAVTMQLYLSNTVHGGATTFPNADPKSLDLMPRRGDLLIWYSFKGDGRVWGSPASTVDAQSLHFGGPVLQGDKWVMNTFIRPVILNGANYTHYTDPVAWADLTDPVACSHQQGCHLDQGIATAPATGHDEV